MKKVNSITISLLRTLKFTIDVSIIKHNPINKNRSRTHGAIEQFDVRMELC